MFSLDGMLYRFGDFILKGLVVGFIWLVGCLPIITIGTSTTATYYACMKLASDDNKKFLPLYWKSYKENWLQSIILYLPFILIGISAVYFHMNRAYFNRLGEEITSVFMVLSFIVLIITLNMFPLLAKFNLKTIDIYKLSFVFCYVNIQTVIKTVALLTIAIISCIIFPVYFFIIIGMYFLLTAKFYQKAFQKVIDHNGMLNR